MPPDPSLKRVDFSKQVSVSIEQFVNFPSAAVTFCFWIRYNRRSFDTTNLPLISYNVVSSSDHPNSGGPSFVIADPSNISIWVGGSRLNTGVSVDDGDWHHVAISVRPDVETLVVYGGPEYAWEQHRVRTQFVGPDTVFEFPPTPPTTWQGYEKRTVVSTVVDGQPRSEVVVPGGENFSLNSGCPFSVTFPFFEFQQQEGDSRGGRRLSDRYMGDLGSIAEIRVWDGVRTLKQIGVELTGFLGNQPDRLRLHWSLGFSGSLQTTVRDTTDNHNDGTLVASIATPPWVYDPIPWRQAPMDLSGVDLSKAEIQGIPLQGRDLTGANLASAGLDNADLSSAKLSGADMRRASLKGTRLPGANLHAVNFDNTVLTGATFSQQPDWSRDATKRTILTNATVSVAILGRDWSYLHLTGASVAGLDPSSDLSRINASKIVFRGAPMAGCRFQYANFDGADLTDTDLNDAELANCSMESTTLYNANLSGATLSHANMTRAKLGGAGASQAENSAVLSYAFMPGVVLTNAELYGVDLSFAQIYGNAKVDSAHLEDADLSNANLSGMDFTQAHMKGVDLTSAILVNCKLNGVDLGPSEGNKPSSLTGAHLEGADFTAAILNGANLSGAAVALTAGTLSVQRVDENGRPVSANATYSPTAIAIGAGDKNTTWPDRSRGVLKDTAQLLAPVPPPPPECIPSETHFCPRPSRRHR